MLRKLAGPLQRLILTYISTTEGLDDSRQRPHGRSHGGEALGIWAHEL